MQYNIILLRTKPVIDKWKTKVATINNSRNEQTYFLIRIYFLISKVLVYVVVRLMIHNVQTRCAFIMSVLIFAGRIHEMSQHLLIKMHFLVTKVLALTSLYKL